MFPALGILVKRQLIMFTPFLCPHCFPDEFVTPCIYDQTKPCEKYQIKVSTTVLQGKQLHGRDQVFHWYTVGFRIWRFGFKPERGLAEEKFFFHLALSRKIRIYSFVVEIQSMQLQCIGCMLIIDDHGHLMPPILQKNPQKFLGCP